MVRAPRALCKCSAYNGVAAPVRRAAKHLEAEQAVKLKIQKTDVWVVDVVNKPGMLARVLEALAAAGAALEFVVARRVTENTARAFVAPLRGARQARAAADVGMQKASSMHTLRIEGPDRPGLGATITRRLADAGLNLRGLSAAAIGKKSICYVAFESDSAASRAATLLKKI